MNKCLIIMSTFLSGGNAGGRGNYLDRARGGNKPAPKKEPTKDYPGRPPKQERPVKNNEEPKFEGSGKFFRAVAVIDIDNSMFTN